MTLKIAEHWFERRRIDADITLLWEPQVLPLMRCNIWHLRGRDRDLMIDTGMGYASLIDATRDLIDKPVIAVATHTHADHIGGHHEFESCLVHAAEAENLRQPQEGMSLYSGDFSPDLLQALARAGYEVPENKTLITALPHAGYDPATYGLRPSRVTHIVEDGSAVDTGDRHFEVLHLPGHSPGSIGLWEEKTGILFSGDCIYDGALLDGLGHSDIPAYRTSLKRLRRLPVTIVHAGHEPSFGRARLHELIDAYLARRGD
jgi:glyoxylase-like metal-dependent hydrolase (beta-lactamase superfamily II)